ncbi:hypothetical protein GCM10022251_62810 [Phytohabitans flavus]|uniref:Uncharacterized protein n=1 Tax=Phytohabitans flavus TaxID=1076124 RepID=A0A6F8Y588_9ACTN|nr:hypothetical protein Pflav_076370 [Phytohabitans flavus]
MSDNDAVVGSIGRREQLVAIPIGPAATRPLTPAALATAAPVMLHRRPARHCRHTAPAYGDAVMPAPWHSRHPSCRCPAAAVPVGLSEARLGECRAGMPRLYRRAAAGRRGCAGTLRHVSALECRTRSVTVDRCPAVDWRSLMTARWRTCAAAPGEDADATEGRRCAAGNRRIRRASRQ